MNNLPINAGNVTATSVNQQFSSEDLSQLDAQDFGNLLARQVAGSAKTFAATDLASADVLLPGEDKDKQFADTPVDTLTSTLPADILATLLGQQNPAAIAQTGMNMQAIVNAKISTDTTELSAGKTSKQTVGINSKTAALETDMTTVAVPGQAKTDGASVTANPTKADDFSAALKLSAAKDLVTESTSKSIKPNIINDILISPHQSGMSATLPAVTATALPVSISTPLTQPAWGEDFSQKITWMVSQRNQSAELHLNPPQLGPLDVSLKINGDQATAMFTSPHAAVRDAIEQAIPRLREMLAESGIMLGNAMVNDQAARNNQDKSSSPSRGSASAATATASADSNSAQETRVTSIKRHNGVVDTFA